MADNLAFDLGSNFGDSVSDDAVILDFDGSADTVENARKLSLTQFGEKIWYAATFKSMDRLESAIVNGAEGAKVFFTGSGDFHHVTYALVKAFAKQTFRLPVQMVVFDNHPDNMIFPGGIHCGSWVYHVGRLPFVAAVSVFGIASNDLGGVNLFQNHYCAIRKGKVKYYCLAPVPKLARLMGGMGIVDLSQERGRLAEIVRGVVKGIGLPVYLSVDKDVLCADAARTSWDQGLMGNEELLECISAVAGDVVIADVTGEIAGEKFKSRLKKFFRWIDGGTAILPDEQAQRQKHREINGEILRCLTHFRST
ncbi:MAG: arginase family protein [Nitrospirae bacterium]|nr:arginase family protein [Nitrospirota bacterium]